ncbi:DUF2570 domain-containing protein [Gallibacterium salpingitidis]|uniref:DUF2570 domain-containing protein n=1 Tax=Gallibacterium salpingitidis TaxID=505341 RepID=A0A1A7NTK4_9PAST|nr:DUF2570 domain-containing protein [Gallibacterium salpingitidis]OBW92993.1 hypothetical protein QS62_07975 [Gallibacterium salpingitidis]
MLATNKWLYVIAIIALLLISVVYQYNLIKDLKVEMAKQSDTIAIQSATIIQLHADMANNQKLTLELSKQESDARSKSDDVIKNISADDKASDAYNSAAPKSIIDFLRK